MIGTIKAFVLGMTEFRNGVTTNTGQHELAYDRGREFAHRITLRRYDA